MLAAIPRNSAPRPPRPPRGHRTLYALLPARVRSGICARGWLRRASRRHACGDPRSLHLGRRFDKVAPDLAGWRRERLPELPDTAAFTLPPDWTCEVLSEGTERLDRVTKARIYARGGVTHYWLVHPVLQTLEVMRNEGGRWVTVAGFAIGDGDALIRAEPFDAIELDLGALFRA